MQKKLVVQVKAESYIEEQLLLDRFPEAVWVNLSGRTLFFLPEDRESEIDEFIQECERRER